MNNKLKNISKNIKQNWKIIIVVIITALVTGWIVHDWQGTKAKVKTDKLAAQILKLQDRISNLEVNIEMLTDERSQQELPEFLEEMSALNAEIQLLRAKIDYMVNEALRQSKKEPLFFYLEKLNDPNFTSTYGHGYTSHIAAEKLGYNIGKPAIPYLIKKLDTEDNYERTQVLYALRLTAQHENVKAFTGGEFPTGGHDLAFPPPHAHSPLVKAWKQWWDKYKKHWD